MNPVDALIVAVALDSRFRSKHPELWLLVWLELAEQYGSEVAIYVTTKAAELLLAYEIATA